MLNLSKEMEILYSNKLGGYSYFQNKSQTHYYGVRITDGLDTPDIHATLVYMGQCHDIRKQWTS